MLTIHNVSKQFVGHRALNDVSFDVPQGAIYGLLGPNGAGKTTMLRIINHITAPDSGHVTFDGHQLTQHDVSMIGYLPEERGLYKKMKVGEQAVFMAQLKGLSRKEAKTRLLEWFDRMGMQGWWDKKVEELSKGMAQKVQFVITVVHNPKLLIFDEPFSGLDPINAELLRTQILDLRDHGSTIILSTHNMAGVEQMCQSITLLNKGQNILTGSVDAVRRSHGGRRYRVVWSDGNLTDAVIPMSDDIISVNETEGAQPNQKSALITLTDRASLHDIIASLNDRLDLQGFNIDLPSMDEIFINAVKTSNNEK